MINLFKNIYRFSQKEVQKKSLLFRLFPDKYHPYISLGRYDKPIGFMLLYWPCAWGLALVSPLPSIFDFGLFLFGSISLRAAGCIINDIADKQFDKNVQRTKDRPLANNSLTITQALKLLIPNLCCGLLTLTQLPIIGIATSFIIVPVIIIYPLMKRYTNYPQLVLGIAFNWGVIIAYFSRSQFISSQIFAPIYIAGILWTLIYDTIYAFQDIKDDQKIGVKSTAITWKQNHKLIFNRFIFASFILMSMSAISGGFTPISGIGLAISHLIWRKRVLNLNVLDTAQCGRLFKHSTYFGFAITVCLLIGNIYKSQIYEKKKQGQNVV